MPRPAQIIKELAQTVITVSAIAVICIYAVHLEKNRMAKRDAQKQLYYRELEACHNQGLVNDKQYNLLYDALADDVFTIEYKSQPLKGSGHQVQWIIKTTGKVD